MGHASLKEHGLNCHFAPRVWACNRSLFFPILAPIDNFSPTPRWAPAFRVHAPLRWQGQGRREEGGPVQRKKRSVGRGWAKRRGPSGGDALLCPATRSRPAFAADLASIRGRRPRGYPASPFWLSFLCTSDYLMTGNWLDRKRLS